MTLLLSRDEFDRCCLEIKRIGEEIGEFWSWLDFKVRTYSISTPFTHNCTVKEEIKPFIILLHIYLFEINVFTYIKNYVAENVC